ncbi:hypothetical protein AB0D33_28765 [Streptomyces sp. NPDC048404]|uniref:hypothetical protein n=1 Tax=unclassified Streptomyces TaxID=2593676 RepID=UPI0034385EAB
MLATGSQGVLHREASGYLWTTTYNRTTKSVPELDGVPQDAIVRTHDDFNRVAYTKPREDGGTDVVRVGMEDPGFTSTISVPAGYLNPRVANGWVLATVDQGDGTHQLRVARGGAPASDPVVQLPAGATTGAEPVLLGAYSNQLVIGYTTADGTQGYGVLTAYNGKVAPLPVTGEARSFRITQNTVSWFSRSGEPGVRIMQRGSTAAPRIVRLTTQAPDSEVTSFVVGDNVLWHEGADGAPCTPPPSQARRRKEPCSATSNWHTCAPRARARWSSSARTPTASAPYTCSAWTVWVSSPTCPCGRCHGSRPRTARSRR